MIRILIADDHFIVREGLKQIVSDVPDMVVVDEASDGQEALRKALGGSFDIIILDISMPVKSGLDVLQELKQHKPDANVLILSVHPEEHYAMRVLKAGASGYLTKESAPDELVRAIRRISQGRKYITATLAEKLAGVVERPADVPLHSTLSEREFRVMVMIASGYSIKEISEKLFLSIKTVSTYRTRILKKMNFKNNSELIRYSIENGLGS
ncbi:MAG: Response regulator UvrY [Syntrophorhabdus sp. PtaB.Bin047]|jgi:DNA-binding NarL/FixJ family response regulator|nr:MAG: Response regulator UvrY [Syntrophorhabdus sp. PtaB.Bin047]